MHITWIPTSGGAVKYVHSCCLRLLSRVFKFDFQHVRKSKKKSWPPRYFSLECMERQPATLNYAFLRAMRKDI